MVGVTTILESIKNGIDTQQLTLKTTTLSGNQTHDILIDENDDKVDSLTFTPSDVTTPDEALILLVRPVVASGSTNSTLYLHEKSNREDVSEVIRIQNLSTSDPVETFQPGTGNGIQFQNQDGNDEWYLRIREDSGIDAEYEVRFRWFDVTP